ncbi:MAG: hypothetical protein AABZ12_01090 [Planctomycetota bacterium]
MSRSWIVIAMIGAALWAGTAVAPRAALAQAAAPKMEGVKIDGEYGPFLPTDVSRDGHRIDGLIDLLHYFMIALFVGWGIFFVYCLAKFRQRPGRKADYEMVKAKPSKYAEIVVAIFEAVLLLGFSIPIWASVKTPDPDPNPVKVRVIAEQFAWNFHYPGKDGKFGKTAPKFINTATNPAGVDPSDPVGNDDVVSGELHLPVNKSAMCEITSKDVIHSFFIPVMRVKQDAVPGMRIPVWFHPVKTGTYEVACAQLCGNNHYSMRALLFLQTESDYNAWLEKKSAPAETFDEG